jgi:hypothetical protein
MGLLFVVVGVILIVSAIRNTTGSLATHISQDFNSGFLAWLGAILLIGMVGYLPKMQTISRLFLALVVLVLFLKQGTGFFESFLQQIKNAPAAQPIPPPAPANIPDPTIHVVPGQGQGITGGGSGIMGGLDAIGGFIKQFNIPGLR